MIRFIHFLHGSRAEGDQHSPLQAHIYLAVVGARARQVTTYNSITPL
jgi:hypothetical protein